MSQALAYYVAAVASHSYALLIYSAFLNIFIKTHFTLTLKKTKKSEALKANYSGCFGWRIAEAYRQIYKIKDGRLPILQGRNYYS